MSGSVCLVLGDDRIIFDARRNRASDTAARPECPTIASGTPPEAVISRSLSPASVSIDERNEPAAAVPAKIDRQHHRDAQTRLQNRQAPCAPAR